VQIDYLRSVDSSVHAVNCFYEGTDLEVGVLCLISCQETTIRISDEKQAFTIEIPDAFRSGSERVKGFNVTLNVLSHEQV
jgi:hypothetical protein